MKQVYPVTIESGMSQSGSCILMLHEPEGQRQVPVVIGRYEAQNILLALNPEDSGKLRRPMTHQLMVQVINTYGLSLKEVTIDRVVEGVFFATLHMTDGFNEKTLDSRTTDAVTLALLTGAPIMMDERVLEETGVRVESGERRVETGEWREESGERNIEALEEELRMCEEREDYERAEEIQKEIEELRTKHQS